MARNEIKLIRKKLQQLNIGQIGTVRTSKGRTGLISLKKGKPVTKPMLVEDFMKRPKRAKIIRNGR